MRWPSIFTKRCPTGLMKPIGPSRFFSAAKSPTAIVVLPSFCCVAATKTRGVVVFTDILQIENRRRRARRGFLGEFGIQFPILDRLQTDDSRDAHDVIDRRAARHVGPG